jgi:DNA-binding NarL/FixJ family response regulator
MTSPLCLWLLEALITHDPRLVVAGSVENGRATVAQAQRRCAHAIIYDMRMPVMDGLQVLPLLRRTCPDSVIVTYSSAPKTPGTRFVWAPMRWATTQPVPRRY